MSAPVSPPNGSSDSKPLITHVIFRFDYGGLENGLVNLINHMPEAAFRHCVVALTEVSDYRRRLQRSDVPVYSLGKRPGKDLGAYLRLFRLLRQLQPAILHTRNIGTLDCAPLGRLAGVPVCVHGEHGWDMHDPDGQSERYRRRRRAIGPFVQQFVTVSTELYDWLTNMVGIPANKVRRVCNGVDTARFSPRCSNRHPEIASLFGNDSVVVGSVLRFNEIKDPLNLVEGFLSARRQAAQDGVKLCLAMIGDGPLREAALSRIGAAGAAGDAWLPGSRDDVPDLLRSMDVFALPSRREGISNTLLEAMATGLPLVATNNGGNAELVEDGTSGVLVPTGDHEALAEALVRLALDEGARAAMAQAARKKAVSAFSLDSMVAGYQHIYEALASSCQG